MVKIERAGVKDHGIVTQILLDYPGAESWKLDIDRDRWDRVTAELLNSDGWLFLLARHDGEPAGVAAVNYHLSLFGTREDARLVMLVVKERFRRRGVGTCLMKEVLAASKRRGCRLIEACVSGDDAGLDLFFRRFGCSAQGRMFTWSGESED